jgi:hypothetical protein
MKEGDGRARGEIAGGETGGVLIATATDYYPLVLLDMGDVGRSQDDFDRMFETFRRVNERGVAGGTRHVLVAITRNLLTASERRMVVDRSNRFPRSDFALWLGVVLVIQNQAVRGVVTALSWMIPGIPPMLTAPTADLAVPLAVAHLRKNGVAYPAGRDDHVLEWFRRQRELPAAAASRSRG